MIYNSHKVITQDCRSIFKLKAQTSMSRSPQMKKMRVNKRWRAVKVPGLSRRASSLLIKRSSLRRKE